MVEERESLALWQPLHIAHISVHIFSSGQTRPIAKSYRWPPLGSRCAYIPGIACPLEEVGLRPESQAAADAEIEVCILGSLVPVTDVEWDEGKKVCPLLLYQFLMSEGLSGLSIEPYKLFSHTS